MPDGGGQTVDGVLRLPLGQLNVGQHEGAVTQTDRIVQFPELTFGLSQHHPGVRSAGLQAQLLRRNQQQTAATMAMIDSTGWRDQQGLGLKTKAVGFFRVALALIPGAADQGMRVIKPAIRIGNGRRGSLHVLRQTPQIRSDIVQCARQQRSPQSDNH